MLPQHLTTNEVKNAAGTEVEFLRLRDTDRMVEFAKSGEAPNLQHRIKVQHQEIGSGVDKRRRSNIFISKEITGVSGTKRIVSFSGTLDAPVGDIADLTGPSEILANFLSLSATTGAATTVLFDGTGYGAASLINGSL